MDDTKLRRAVARVLGKDLEWSSTTGSWKWYHKTGQPRLWRVDAPGPIPWSIAGELMYKVVGSGGHVAVHAGHNPGDAGPVLAWAYNDQDEGDGIPITEDQDMPTAMAIACLRALGEISADDLSSKT